MKINDIIDLQEISPNHWRAKYQGNYGVYTIKISFDKEGEVSNFSCSCPSNYSPCKHISIVKEAIEKRIAQSKHSGETEDKTLTVDELLKNVSFQELHDFVIRQAKYNIDLTNAVKLEFAHKLTDESTNPYSSILQDIMDDIYFDYDDYYEQEENLDLDDLQQWFEKARAYVEQQNYHEAVLICKACIEEFAEWMHNEDTEVVDYIDIYYQIEPFEIMEKAAASPDVDSKSLYDYCLSEINKDKYSDTAMFDKFNDLLAILAGKVNSNEFIDLQDSLLKKIDDNSSHEAEKILQRKINFYNDTQQPEKANALIEKNMQIENFRHQIVTKLLAEQDFVEAKRLIEDFVQEKRDIGRDYTKNWDDMLLEIAQKENDIPNIRKIAFSFINRNFDKKYFDIYKSAFTSEEWTVSLENILQHYEKNSRDFNYYSLKTTNFSSAAADVLVAEDAVERLLQYIEKNLSEERIEKYYFKFADLYPEKTLELFRKAIDEYAEKNIGRVYYEHIAKLFEQMLKIKNGAQTVAEIVSNYRIKYKNRRVMIEILSGF
jgi:uncharacterized protein (DUF2267 family)